MARTLGGAPASAFDTLTVTRGVRCRRRYPRKAAAVAPVATVAPVADLPAFDLPPPRGSASPARVMASHRVAPDSTGTAASVVKGGIDSVGRRPVHAIPAPLVGVAFRRVGDDLLLVDLATGDRWPRR